MQGLEEDYDDSIARNIAIQIITQQEQIKSKKPDRRTGCNTRPETRKQTTATNKIRGNSTLNRENGKHKRVCAFGYKNVLNATRRISKGK